MGNTRRSSKVPLCTRLPAAFCEVGWTRTGDQRTKGPPVAHSTALSRFDTRRDGSTARETRPQRAALVLIHEVVGAPPEQIAQMRSLPAWEGRRVAAHTIPRELRADTEYARRLAAHPDNASTIEIPWSPNDLRDSLLDSDTRDGSMCRASVPPDLRSRGPRAMP